MFWRPSRMVTRVFESHLFNQLDKASIPPFSTRILITSGFLFAVVLDKLQMASLYTSRASWWAIIINLSMTPASNSILTCSSLEAQTFDKVQVASFLMTYSWCSRQNPIDSINPFYMTTSVYSSDPVTQFPINLRFGTCIPWSSLHTSSTNLGTTPVSIIEGMVVDPPSEM